MHIAIILGSTREGRRTDKVAYFLASRMQAIEGIGTEVIDLMTSPLPIYRNRWRQQAEPDPLLVQVGQVLERADGIILCSPEYHGSYTGALKNALDHYWDEFYRKPMGVVATGSGKFGGINASTQMQHLILSLGAYPMPHKLLVPFVKETFDAEGKPLREDVIQQTEKFVDEYLRFAGAIRNVRIIN